MITTKILLLRSLLLSLALEGVNHEKDSQLFYRSET